MNRGIGKLEAAAIVDGYFNVTAGSLDDLLCAVLRVERVSYPLPRWLTEAQLRAKLESTRALFADTFRVRV